MRMYRIHIMMIMATTISQLQAPAASKVSNMMTALKKTLGIKSGKANISNQQKAEQQQKARQGQEEKYVISGPMPAGKPASANGMTPPPSPTAKAPSSGIITGDPRNNIPSAPKLPTGTPPPPPSPTTKPSILPGGPVAGSTPPSVSKSLESYRKNSNAESSASRRASVSSVKSFDLDNSPALPARSYNQQNMRKAVFADQPKRVKNNADFFDTEQGDSSIGRLFGANSKGKTPPPVAPASQKNPNLGKQITATVTASKKEQEALKAILDGETPEISASQKNPNQPQNTVSTNVKSPRQSMVLDDVPPPSNIMQGAVPPPPPGPVPQFNTNTTLRSAPKPASVPLSPKQSFQDEMNKKMADRRKKMGMLDDDTPDTSAPVSKSGPGVIKIKPPASAANTLRPGEIPPPPGPAPTPEQLLSGNFNKGAGTVSGSTPALAPVAKSLSPKPAGRVQISAAALQGVKLKPPSSNRPVSDATKEQSVSDATKEQSVSDAPKPKASGLLGGVNQVLEKKGMNRRRSSTASLNDDEQWYDGASDV